MQTILLSRRIDKYLILRQSGTLVRAFSPAFAMQIVIRKP
nr:MAG TPA: hypothetical protein [Caudoviricetes sp.]